MHVARFVLLLLIGTSAVADDDRARVNYMLHCQGCHLPDASGAGDDVPQMRDFLGYFLHTAEGRAFVVQVPGVSMADLPDDELAELLNWLLRHFSADQLPDDYEPYDAAEVSALRRTPEQDPLSRRIDLLRAVAREKPDVADALKAY